MMILMIFIILILIGIAVHYYRELERSEEYIFELESRPNESKIELDNRKLKEELIELRHDYYQANQTVVNYELKLADIENEISKNQFGSVKNLQNKIKTILENTTPSNID